MALFKTFRGQRTDLDNVAKVDGHAYFCMDDGTFWIDYKDNGEVKRKQINKEDWTKDIQAAVAALKSEIEEQLVGKTDYLGVVNTIPNFPNAGAGDYCRVSTEFVYDAATGEKAHVGDVLIALKDNPSQSISDWDLIHTEMDADTWVANTATAAGYVEKGEGNPNKVWATDAEGNPAWRDEINSNIINGEGEGSVQQLPNGVADGFDFTGKNPNATLYDSTLTGVISYGATGAFASSFGGKSAAMGKRSHAEGTTTIAKGKYSHAEGDNSVTLGNDSHAEGYQTMTGPDATAAHSEGYGTLAIGHSSHAEGHMTGAIKLGAHAEGYLSTAAGRYSHAEGQEVTAEGTAAHAEGYLTKTSADYSHAEGNSSQAIGYSSHAEGSVTIAEGNNSHAEGIASHAEGIASHAEGNSSHAQGENSHAEGNSSQAIGYSSHAEGSVTIAEGNNSHAEGYGSHAEGANSHAEGTNTIAKGVASHAEGDGTEALHNNSHASGYKTKTGRENQTVIGEFNEGKESTLFEVGNGTSETIEGRSNAFEVYKDGRAKVYGAPKEENDVVRKKELTEALVGKTEYLGTITAITELSSSAGKGDFYRVSTAFAFGDDTAHVGDILLATKDNPIQDVTDWDLIHTDCDTNTWVANTKTAAGYVAKGEDNPNSVWATDESGNPAWRQDNKVTIANAISGLYTIYGKRKIAGEGELFPEFEDGSETTFAGAYYPNSADSFNNGNRRIVMWGKKGTFSVDMAEDRGEEPEDKHVTNRKWVVDNFRASYKPTTAFKSYVYRAFKKTGGSIIQDAIPAEVSADANSIMLRDGSGCAKINVPAEPADTSVVNVAYMKQYIKEHFAELISEYLAENATTADDIKAIFSKEA